MPSGSLHFRIRSAIHRKVIAEPNTTGGTRPSGECNRNPTCSRTQLPSPVITCDRVPGATMDSVSSTSPRPTSPHLGTSETVHRTLLFQCSRNLQQHLNYQQQHTAGVQCTARRGTRSTLTGGPEIVVPFSRRVVYCAISLRHLIEALSK